MSPDKDPITPRVNAVITQIEGQCLKIIGGNKVVKGNIIKLVKQIAKYYIWAFGIMLAHLAVLRQIITFPNSESQLQLMILLYIFDAAWIVALLIDIYHKNLKRQ